MAFEPDTPTIGTLVQRAVSNIDAELGAEAALNPDAPEYVLAAVAAGLAHHCYGVLRAVARNIVPNANMDEAAAQEHARYWLGNDDGRRDASPATLPIVDDGSSVAGTEIEPGTRWRAANGALYENVETLIVGTDDIEVQSIAAEGETGYGESGNLTPGTTLTLVTEVVGLASTWTVDGDPEDGEVGGGADQETIAELAERIEFAAQNPPSGGTGADYVRWARDVAGVGKAWAYARIQGPGTITVFFTRSDANNPIPDSTLVDTVREYLEEKAPLQVGLLHAVAPVASEIDFTIALKPNNADTRAAVTTALRAVFTSRIVPGDGETYVDISWFREAISSAVGETGHTMTVPAADFTPDLGDLPVLGTITFSTKA